VHDTFRSSRYELLVDANDSPRTVDEHLTVPERATRPWLSLAQAQHDIDVVTSRCIADAVRRGTRHFNRIVEQSLCVITTSLAERGEVVVPDRVAGHESLGEGHDVCAIRLGLLDSRAGLVDRRLAIQEDGGELSRS
jgi:hypothetical protein